MGEFAENAIRQAPLWLAVAALITMIAQLLLLIYALVTSLAAGMPMASLQLVAGVPELLFRPAILLGMAAIISALRRR